MVTNKINYYSINESAYRKNIRRITMIPFREVIHRGLNRIYKKLCGGLLPFPQNIHIELTNVCNLRCIMCPISQQHRKQGFMDFEMFRKIVQQCVGQFSLEKMALMGLGEPFLHKEIIPMSNYAKKMGIHYIFTSTNGTLISEEISEDIILKSGFDMITFSMDGVNKDTYEKVRVNAKYEKVIQNILNFIKIRRKYRRKTPRINMQILVMKETVKEIDDYVSFWKSKLDSQDVIFLRDVDTFGGQVDDHRLNSQLPKIERVPCIQLWRDMSVSWDGLVTVCCKDVGYKLKVSNIFENSISEIWKGKQWKKIRDIHLDGDYNKIQLCKNCNEWNQ